MQTIEWIEHDRKKEASIKYNMAQNREGTFAFTYNNEFDYRIK